MAAYVIFIREHTSNKQELKTYEELAPLTLSGRPVTPLALYGALDVLEGPIFEGAVVLEFPSTAEAKDWYNSPAYQAAAKHRLAGSTYRAFIIEGASKA